MDQRSVAETDAPAHNSTIFTCKIVFIAGSCQTNMAGITKATKHSVVAKLALREVSNIFMDKMLFVYIINSSYYHSKDKRVLAAASSREPSTPFQEMSAAVLRSLGEHFRC